MDFDLADCVLVTSPKGGADVTRQQKRPGQDQNGNPYIYNLISRSLFLLEPGDKIEPKIGHEVVVFQVDSRKRKSQGKSRTIDERFGAQKKGVAFYCVNISLP